MSISSKKHSRLHDEQKKMMNEESKLEITFDTLLYILSFQLRSLLP